MKVCRIIALTVVLLTSSLGAQVMDARWSIVAGSEPLSQTAAEDLKLLLAQEQGVELAGDAQGPRIFVGTVADNPAIAAAHRAQPFRLPEDQPEAYHMAARDGNLYIVGTTAKGAMNGVFRFLDRRSLDVSGLDESAAPAMRHRVGGHRINQAPPPGWSEIDQARFMARHYINIAWGEKHGPPLSLEVRQKYGLGLMVEMKFPPFLRGSRDYMDDPKYASAVYYHKGNEGRRVLDPFDAVGRQAYLDGFAELLSANPDTTILYSLFGDYSVIPSPDSRRMSDGAVYGHTRIETMQQVKGLMREALQQAGMNDAVAVAWLWHGFFGEPPGAEAQFMAWLRDNGYGILYNEAGNNDNWLIRRDNFSDLALKTGEDGKIAWGENYYPLVSVGGSCESVNPAIAMPLPFVAAHKLDRLMEAKVNNLVLWWGSAEGWAYSPNLEVLARAIWEPSVVKDPDRLLREIAERDFGAEHADAILEYWRMFDRALVTEGALYQPVEKQAPPDQDGLHINDWYQRMGIFTEAAFSQAFAKPLTKDALADHEPAKKGTYWGTHDRTLANYAHVLAGLAAAQQKLKGLIDSGTLSAASRERATQSYLWAELYRTLLASQHNYLRALRAVHGRADDPVEPSQIDGRLAPVVQDELANIEAMIAVLEQLPPNANIRQPHLGVVMDQGSTAQEIAALRAKAAAMRFESRRLVNLAKGKVTTASSVKTEGGQTFRPEFATDGDLQTRWASTFRDAEWLNVDLGANQRFDAVRIHWKTAYPADFEIQVAPAEDPSAWRTIHHDTSAGGGVSVIELDPPAEGRYVRMKANKQATAWGYSIQEFEVLVERP